MSSRQKEKVASHECILHLDERTKDSIDGALQNMEGGFFCDTLHKATAEKIWAHLSEVIRFWTFRVDVVKVLLYHVTNIHVPVEQAAENKLPLSDLETPRSKVWRI